MGITPTDLREAAPEVVTKFSSSELETFAGLFSVLELEEGELLFGSGERIEGLYLVRLGALSAFIAIDDRPFTLGEYGPGGVLGECVLIKSCTSAISVRAVRATRLLFLPRANLHRLRSEHPRIASQFLHHLALRMAKRLQAYEETRVYQTESNDLPWFKELGRKLLGTHSELP